MTSIVGGIDWVAVQKTFQNWVVAGSQLDAQKVVWAQQDAPRPPSPAIELRLSNLTETGQCWLAYEDNPLVLPTVTISAVTTGAGGYFTANGHGLVTGDGPVQYNATTTFPAPIAADTNYWVIALDANRFQLASSFLNAMNGMPTSPAPIPIVVTGAGAGVQTLFTTGDSLRAGEETLAVVRGLHNITLELHCHTAAGVGIDMATSVLNRVRNRRLLPSQLAALQAANIGLIGVEHVRAIAGVRDAVLFEPRAYLEIHFCVPSVEYETGTIITSVAGTVDVTDESGDTSEFPFDVDVT